MSDFIFPRSNLNFDLEKFAILVTLAGSKSYGTDTPESDTDYKGILVAPREVVASPFKSFEQFIWKGEDYSGRVSEVDGVAEAEEEGTFFALHKFVILAANCNPNVIETLFVDDEHVLHITEEGELLRANKELFLSERALKTFTGYAMSQLKRIKTHKNWIDNPPKHQPTREEFGLPPERVLSPDQVRAAERFIELNLESIAPWLLESDTQNREAFWESIVALLSVLIDNIGLEYDLDHESWIEMEQSGKDLFAQNLGFEANFMEHLRSEKAYAQAKKHYQQYQGWLKNRNPARAELEARYGYDCKHAMHLVRLLRMGEEILTTGTMNVFRPDREELKEIRNGSWAYDDLIIWADERVDFLYDLVRSGRSVVPKKPKQNEIENLVLEIQDRVWCKE